MKSTTVVLVNVLENAIKVVVITELFIYCRTVMVVAITDKIILKVNINFVGIFHHNFINIISYFKSFLNCFQFVADRVLHNMNSLIRFRFVEYKLQVCKMKIIWFVIKN